VNHAAYRADVAAALESGWRFGALYATAGGIVRVLLVGTAGETRLEAVSVEGGAVPSIVDLVPAADWDEREAHDLYGVAFTGHDPLRPLATHDLDLSRWTVPVRGPDAYQVAVGPIHAGVIESGHFRFHVVGDRILHVDARLFYKHRGLEKAAEGSTLEAGVVFAGRACGACAVANSVAYALACESACGLRATSELARVRTILLELERVWSHLNDLAAVCAGTGLAAGNNRFAELTERARRLNATLTGHRFLFATVRVGGSDVALDEEAVRLARRELALLRDDAASGCRELSFNASFQDRLPDIGIVSADDVRLLGTVGPAARAAGVAEDVRATATGLAYDDFEPVLPARAVGDVQARVEQRALELWQSFDILERLLDRPVARVTADHSEAEREIGVGRVESPRGATSCVVERAGDRVGRLHLRTGSYANWPSVARAATDDLFPDFPLINKSFELCYACVDR
jgi:Ni,Fe-hydrogenase III large subunit